MNRRMMLRWCIVLGMAGVCVACGSAPIRVTTSDYQIVATLEVVGLGKRPIAVQVRDSAGNDVTDARVELLPVMEQHGMLSPPITLVHDVGGMYRYPELDLTMSGEWQLKCAITRNGVRNEVAIPVVIE